MSKFYYFVLLGAPGSGKGTQGEILAKKFNLLRISPGEILRKMIKENPNDDISLEIESYTSKGNLVPIAIINKVLIRYIELHKNDYKGILFDGYPRSLEQNDFLNSHITPTGLDASIYLEISLDQLLDRLLYRQVCEDCGSIFNTKHNKSTIDDKCDKCGAILKKRNDDSSEIIAANRFKIFSEQSFPIIEKYKNENKLITVKADKDIPSLSLELIDIFNKIIDV
jgi:adenylate kinase